MKILKLVEKFIRVQKEYGFWIAIGRIFHFIGNVEGRRLRRKDICNARNTQGDILFINGCCVEHPTRYRVHHQMEQLQEAGLVCAKVYFEDVEFDMENNYRVFIFYRCECTNEIERFIRHIKSHNKKVCFDIDDLITDTKYTDLVPFVEKLPASDKKLFDGSISRIGKTLSLCDIAITTTEALAEELGKVVPKTYINRNVASKEMVMYSEQAYLISNKMIPHGFSESDKIWIGYFSGSATHNKDFAIVHAALMRLMKEYENVGLILVGELDASDELLIYADRIIKRSMTSWKNLPEIIVEADVNLAPLEDTVFNRSKSEIKWIEASLVKVPTVASRTGAFKTMIEDGVTGILCDNTDQGWYEALQEMILNAEKRNAIGNNAYSYVIEHCTTVHTSYKYKEFIESLIIS